MYLNTHIWKNMFLCLWFSGLFHAQFRLQRLRKRLKRSLLPKWRVKLERSWHKLFTGMMLVLYSNSLVWSTLSLPRLTHCTCLQLETALADEMATLIEYWKSELDELETESAHLLVCFFLQFWVNLCFLIHFRACMYFDVIKFYWKDKLGGKKNYHFSLHYNTSWILFLASFPSLLIYNVD